MYCSHFGLNRQPFNNTPDPTFYYSTPEHEEALATLQYATLQRKSFVLVTGEIGAGKTLIGRMFLRQLGNEVTSAVIAHTNLTGSQLLAAVCREFELDVASDASNVELIEQLQSFLLEQFARDRYVVVLIDEGQNLPDESFEELRMLGNLEADDAKLLQVCILGQPELRDKFRQPNMRQLDQRMFRRFHLPALDRAQTEQYITHRLRVAGATRDDIFSTDAIDKIFATSGGIPRIINQICDNALLTAYGKGAEQVTDEVVAEVLEHDMLPAPTKAAEYRGELPHPVVNTAAAPEPANKIPAPMKQQLRNIGKRQKATKEVAQRALSRAQVVEQRVETVAHATQNIEHKVEAVASATRNVDQKVEAVTNTPRGVEQKVEAIANTTRGVEQKVEAVAHNTRDVEKQVEAVAHAARATEQRVESVAHAQAPLKQELENLSSRQREVGRIVEEATSKWQAHRRKFQNYRHQVHQTLEQLREQCQQTQQKLEHLTGASGDADLQGVRQESLNHVDAILKQIERQRDEFQCMLENAEKRWAETRSKLLDLSADAVSHLNLNELESRLDGRMQDLLGQVEQQRDRLTKAGGTVQQQCAQLQLELAAMEERQQRAAADLARQIYTRMEEGDRAVRGVLEEKTQQLTQQQIQVNRQLQEQLAGDLQEACAELRNDKADQAALEQLSQEQEQSHQQLDARLERKADREELAVVREVQQADQQRLGQVQQKLDQARSEITAELGRKADTESVRALEARQAEERAQTLRQMQQKVEAAREELTRELSRKADLDDLQALQAGQVQERAALIKQLQQNLESARQELAAELSRKADVTAVEALQRSQAENRVRILKQVRQKLESTHQEISDKLGRKADLEKLQALEAAQNEDRVRLLQQMQERLVEARKTLEQQIESKASAADLEVARTFQARSQARLAEQINAQIGENRKEIQEQLEDKAANRDVQALRQLHEQRAAEILQRIETSRQEAGKLIEHVMQRCRTAQEQIESLQVDERQDRQEIANVRQRHEEDLAHLLGQLQEQKRLMDEQFGQLIERSVQTRQELEGLRSSSATADELERVRVQQLQDMQQIATALEGQHHELNALLDGVNRRCDQLTARADALPADIATAEQLADVHQEYCREIQRVTQEIADRRRELESSIGQVAQHCDRTEEAVQQLAAKAADKEEVDTLRVIQAQHHNQVLDRLDKQHLDYAEKVESLNRRWQSLTESIDALATITTPTSTFEAAEQSFTRNLQNIREDLVQLNSEQRQQVSELLGRLGQQAERIETLETMDRPAPVRIELTPREQAELRELIGQARVARSEMAEVMGTAVRMTHELKYAAGNISESMRGWVESSGQMQTESEQLRSSAQTAANILKAMQNCNAIIDAKLKSETWKRELERAETLANRLEKVTKQGQALHTEMLSALSRGEETVAECRGWAQQKQEAAVITERLARLLLHSSKASQRFGQMFSAMAGNTTGLAQIINDAREFDENRKSAGKLKPKSRMGEVDRVEWPTLRTHAQVG